jgi:hypothetical protein
VGFGVCLGGFARMMGGMCVVAVRGMGVVGGFFVITRLVVLGSFFVVAGGVLMMLSGEMMMLCGFIRHDEPLIRDKTIRAYRTNYNRSSSNS